MRRTNLFWIRSVLWLGLSLNLCSWSGCSSRPSSELTQEQLEKQLAADAQSIADEDRLEAELKKKAKKR